MDAVNQVMLRGICALYFENHVAPVLRSVQDLPVRSARLWRQGQVVVSAWPRRTCAPHTDMLLGVEVDGVELGEWWSGEWA